MDFLGISMKFLLLPYIVAVLIFLPSTVAIDKLVHHSKVLILGAGMSGITAARTLHENGIDDFTILEGYERIGGRMRKGKFAGTVIEYGANWVQGLKNNPIWDLAQQCSLKGNYTVPNPTPGYYIVRDASGNDVTDHDNLNALAKAVNGLDKIVEERQKAGLGDLDVQTGLRLAGWQAQNPAQSSVEYFYYDYDAAVRPHYISARVNLPQNAGIDSAGGKQFFVFDERGYAYIVEEMASSFLEPQDPRLLVNQVVNNIEWDTDGVQVSTTTGEMYSADYLLVTFSIGVLKSGGVTFSPSLPAQILEPIYKIEMANFIKIFLKFQSKFWDTTQFILYASERRGYYPVWQDLEVDAGLPASGLNILIVTVTGEEATRIQYQSNEQTQHEIMTVLRNVYGNNIPDPLDFFYPRWAHDPLFYGCFSNNPLGISHEDYVALQSNVSRIYFAGEATNELYNGYVHGAYFSGLNRGEKISHDIKANDI